MQEIVYHNQFNTTENVFVCFVFYNLFYKGCLDQDFWGWPLGHGKQYLLITILINWYQFKFHKYNPIDCGPHVYINLFFFLK